MCGWDGPGSINLVDAHSFPTHYPCVGRIMLKVLLVLVYLFYKICCIYFIHTTNSDFVSFILCNLCYPLSYCLNAILYVNTEQRVVCARVARDVLQEGLPPPPTGPNSR